MTTPDWIESVDHTADQGIVVRAPDASGLFERAAWGLFNLLCNIDAVEPVDQTEIRVEAPDRQALMVRWLSELNYLHQTEYRLFSMFKVTKFHDTKLTATVQGETISDEKHEVYTEIKAVTFHALNITEDDSGWKATIIFDV